MHKDMDRYMKRVLCFLIAAALMALTACGDGTTAPTDGTAAETSAATDAYTTTPDEGFDLSDFIEGFDREPTMEAQPVCELGGVSVTAEGVTYDPITGPIIMLAVDNTTERDVLIQTDLAVVNGYMTEVECDFEVEAEKSLTGELAIPYTSLALAGVDELAEIGFTLRILDAESFEVIAESEAVELTTSAKASYEPSFDESGQLAYEGGDVKIILRGIDESGMLTDADALIVYMYNGSDKAVTVQAHNVTVNGFELTGAMNTVILPGKRAVDTVDFFRLELDEYGIASIDTVELSFRILDNSTWETIAESGVISVDIRNDDI